MPRLAGSLCVALILFVVLLIPKTVLAEEESLTAEQEREIQEAAATKEFLGLNWSLGIGAAHDPEGGRVDKASVVNGVVRVEEENNTQARIFLEIHIFCLRKLTRNESCEEPKPLFGQGPWVGVQSSKDQVIDAFGLGWMWGWRTSTTATNSFNLGIGLVLDPKVQVLGDGIEANKPLPTGETAIRFKKESRVGGVLLVSFTF